MKAFVVLSALVALGACAPAPDADAQISGPLHPAFGPIVATKRGPAHIGLEGFSEDDNQDGFVDPIGQVAPVATYAHHVPLVHHTAPLIHHTPVVKTVEPVKVEVKEVKPVEYKVPTVVSHPIAYAAAAPLVHHVATPIVQHVAVPHVSVHKTQYTHTVPVGHHVQTYTTHHVAGAPIAGSYFLPTVAEVKPVEAEVKAE